LPAWTGEVLAVILGLFVKGGDKQMLKKLFRPLSAALATMIV
jgi:hypothetical protein